MWSKLPRHFVREREKQRGSLLKKHLHRVTCQARKLGYLMDEICVILFTHWREFNLIAPVLAQLPRLSFASVTKLLQTITVIQLCQILLQLTDFSGTSGMLFPTKLSEFQTTGFQLIFIVNKKWLL